ncbi:MULTISPECIES: hypothetical protein [Pedobacter]|jgi:hypothetical protein|uniref:hypothetical protein n=1 Tax=Pedobacter TaxID=84567 RepID=UPI000E376782|nr:MULTISPECIES: hypothetical protein [Pedobacter]AZI26879.1 hypothetical protein EA772_16615 [Pedobacter sp. G11]MDQ1143076.1 hypothetical protein [Pedobacter agri]
MRNSFVEMVEETARIQFRFFEIEEKISRMRQWVDESNAPIALKHSVLDGIRKLEKRLIAEAHLNTIDTLN